MAVSLLQIAALKGTFGQKPGEASTEYNLSRTLNEIPGKVTECLEKRTYEVRLGLIHILDTIKAILSHRSRQDILELLNKLYTQDKHLWDGYLWQDIKFQSMAYHEKNEADAHRKEGITPEVLLSLSERNKDDILSPLILKLGAMYGLDTSILLPGFIRREGE